jgi:hypothetical protein
MESTLTWIFAIVMTCVGGAYAAVVQRRADERIRALLGEKSQILARERDLAARFVLVERACIEAETTALMLREDRERERTISAEELARVEAEHAVRYRRIDEALVALAKGCSDAALPEMLSRMTERTATLVLQRIPDDADRNMLALAASTGGLMTAHSYVALALEAMLRKIEAAGGVGAGPFYALRPFDDGGDEADHDNADDDLPPSSGSVN